MKIFNRLRTVLSEPGISALLVIREGLNRTDLQQMFEEAGWTLMMANTCEMAVNQQNRKPIPVILYEREANERDWRTAVSLFADLTPRPCVILLSSSLDKNLRDDFFQCGGFELLRTPIEREAVLRAVRSGWSLWKSQQKLHLDAQMRA